MTIQKITGTAEEISRKTMKMKTEMILSQKAEIKGQELRSRSSSHRGQPANQYSTHVLHTRQADPDSGTRSLHGMDFNHMTLSLSVNIRVRSFCLKPVGILRHGGPGGSSVQPKAIEGGNSALHYHSCFIPYPHEQVQAPPRLRIYLF